MSPQLMGRLLGLLSFTTVLVYGQQQPCSDKSQAVSLKKTLLCGYDKNVRPVKVHTDIIRVKVNMWLKHLSFEEHKNILRLNSWVVWRWDDHLLTWDPSQYNGLDELKVESDSIWIPDIYMHTVGEYSGVHHHMPSTSCILSSKGEVLCVPPTTNPVLCFPDLTKWPFDIQQCSAEMTSWAHAGDRISLELSGKGIAYSDMEEVRGWDLMNATAIRRTYSFNSTDSYQFIEFYFILRRHSSSYAATVVIPALVLAVLTLLMFLLDASCPQRLHLGCMHVLAHCLYLQYLGMNIPSNGYSTPIILIFFRDSLLLVGMSLLTTIILRGMLVAERAPPAWVTSTITWVLESRPGQILILSQLNPQGAASTTNEDGAILVDNASGKQKNNVWGFAAILLDRVCLIVFSITLFILLMAFVP